MHLIQFLYLEIIERLRCVEEKLKGIKCPNCGASVEVNVGEKTG